MRAVLLSLWFVASAAFATGGSEGHGADTEWSDAWFLGKSEPIRYCLEASPAFLAMHTEANYQKYFENAFRLWAQYLVDKQVEPFVLPYWVRMRNQVERHDCKEDGIELKIFFGVCGHQSLPCDDLGTLAAKAIPPKAKLKHPGLIWLAEPNSMTYGFTGKPRLVDWTQPGIIENTLLHEIGHMFGNSHVRGTIMDEHILSQLMSKAVWDRPIPEMSIDGDKELFICASCETETFHGELGWYPDQSLKQWQRFVGNPPTTHQTVLFTLRKNGVSLLTLTDAVSDVPIAIHFNKNTASLFEGEEVFRAEVWAGFPLTRPHTASVQPGFMTFKGQRIKVSLERNMASSEPGRPSFPVALFEMPTSPGQLKKLLFHSGQELPFQTGVHSR